MIVVDLDNNLAVYQSPTNRAALTTFTRKRRDMVRMPVKFLRGGVVAELASGATGKLGVKAVGDYSGDFLASATSWTKEGSATSTTYYFDLNLNTTEIEALFTSDSVLSLSLAMELTWTESSRVHTTPGAILLTVENDYISGAEGVPTNGTPEYPLPAAIELKAEKGVANGYAALDATGKVPVAQLPDASITEAVMVADETARFALTTDAVQLGDFVFQTDTSIMYQVTDTENLDSASGYTALATVPWESVTGKPTTGSTGLDVLAAGTEAAAQSAIGGPFVPATGGTFTGPIGVADAVSGGQAVSRDFADTRYISPFKTKEIYISSGSAISGGGLTNFNLNDYITQSFTAGPTTAGQSASVKFINNNYFAVNTGGIYQFGNNLSVAAQIGVGTRDGARARWTLGGLTSDTDNTWDTLTSNGWAVQIEQASPSTTAARFKLIIRNNAGETASAWSSYKGSGSPGFNVLVRGTATATELWVQSLPNLSLPEIMELIHTVPRVNTMTDITSAQGLLLRCESPEIVSNLSFSISNIKSFVGLNPNNL